MAGFPKVGFNSEPQNWEICHREKKLSTSKECVCVEQGTILLSWDIGLTGQAGIDPATGVCLRSKTSDPANGKSNDVWRSSVYVMAAWSSKLVFGIVQIADGLVD